MRKRIIAIAVAAIVMIAVSLAYFSTKKTDTTLRLTGIVEGVEVNISSKVAGRISRLCCGEGDGVKAEETVVRLDSDDIKAMLDQARAGVRRARAEMQVADAEVENAQANIRTTEADISSAKADREKARVFMEEAKRDLDRQKALYKKGLLSQQLFDQALTGYNESVAEFKSSSAKYNSSVSKKEAAVSQAAVSVSRLEANRAALKEAEANVAYQESRLSDTVIKTPVSGVVVLKAFEEGEAVSPGVTILTIVDMDNLYVRVDVEETKLADIRLGDGALISLPSLPEKTLNGTITEIAQYAAFATQRDVVRGQQDIKTFRVKIRVEGPKEALKPGMTVSVEIPERQ